MIVYHTAITRRTIGFDIYDIKNPFILNQSITFVVSECNEDATRFTVPKNFKSDGASLTFQLAKLVIGCSRSPLFFPGVIAHDYLCANKSICPRKFASDVMLYLFLQRGVPKWKAYLMYWAVEIWQKYKEGWR